MSDFVLHFAGGKCGSTYIDRNLNKLMNHRFGYSFAKLELRRRGPGSRFMDSFESAKRNFSPNDDPDKIYEIGPLRMDDVAESDQYDPEEGLIRLSRHVVLILTVLRLTLRKS